MWRRHNRGTQRVGHSNDHNQYRPTAINCSKTNDHTKLRQMYTMCHIVSAINKYTKMHFGVQFMWMLLIILHLMITFNPVCIPSFQLVLVAFSSKQSTIQTHQFTATYLIANRAHTHDDGRGRKKNIVYVLIRRLIIIIMLLFIVCSVDFCSFRVVFFSDVFCLRTHVNWIPFSERFPMYLLARLFYMTCTYTDWMRVCAFLVCSR